MHPIGILALQGDFAKHQEMISKLERDTILVKKPKELERCSGLVIPGGESTTLVKLLKKQEMWEPVRAFASTQPVFGTCAGCILLATHTSNDLEDSLGLIDIDVTRNAYGRQIDSFIDQVDITLKGKSFHYNAVFIRAPKINKLNTTHVAVLGTHQENVVLAEQGHILVATFHPELTDDTRIHEYFIKKTDGK